MDELENQQTTQPAPTVQSTSPQTSYTSGLRPKKKSPIWILMAIALLLIGGGIFFLVKKGTSSQNASPTSEALSYTTEESEATTEPTATPQAVEKESIKIQILNGTGIAKEASYLQGKLRDLGYTQIETGNAETEDYEATEVYFSSTVADEVVSEITGQLEKIYESVKTKTGSTGKYDVKIITGLQKGATPKPTSTKTPTPTSSSTPRSTSSPTPTPTP